MPLDTIACLAWLFEAGELSGDDFLRRVDLERAISLPPVAGDVSPTATGA